MNNKEKKKILNNLENKDKQINKLQIELNKAKKQKNKLKQKLKNNFSKKCLSKGTKNKNKTIIKKNKNGKFSIKCNCTKDFSGNTCSKYNYDDKKDYYNKKDYDDKNKNCDTNIELQKIEHDNLTREYILYIPTSYNKNNKTPLLLNFHGFGGTAKNHLCVADMRSLADKNNFILVYPQGSLLDGSPHWNSSLPSSDNKSNVDDIGFIDKLLKNLLNEYTIDQNRIYACGYSNGAFFSYLLACNLSQKIAAIGSISGSMPFDISNNCPYPNFPLIIFHGTSDSVVPYEGTKNETLSVNEVIEYFSDNTPIEKNNEGKIEYKKYENKNDKSNHIELYKINNGNHVWFDINYNGKNINELLWDFFSKYLL